MRDASAQSLAKSTLWRGVSAVIAVLMLAVATTSEALANPKFAAIAVDARTGEVLYSSDPDGQRYPASLTKVMTLYMLFQELKAGRMTLATPIKMSQHSSGMPPTKLGVPAGKTVSVEDAIKSLVTLSANDVAAAIGENIAGSEAAFAQRMTKTARALGMSRTTFKNASGLPNPGQVTTARDMATLALRIQRDFPQYYPYFKLTSFNYKGRIIRTHNRLLGKFEGTDGIKTGYIRASGFNLTSSVRRGDKRIIGVVMGGKTGASRNEYMMSMLSKYLPNCKDGKVLAASIKGAPAPKDIELAVAEETQPAAVDQIIEPETKSAKPLATANKPKPKPAAAKGRPSDKTVADLARAAVELNEGDAEDADDEELIAEIPPANPSATTIASLAADEAQVLVAPLPEGSETMVAKQPSGEALPFAVKSDASGTGWTGQVLVPPAEMSWKIQIGAFPNKRAAQDKLRDARKTGVSLLNDKQAFTVQVQKGNETIYRARFSGFSEDAARAACRQLTQKGIGCVALSPQS
ncbi:MAG: D-alanyl-D-alanine carboxypeptidase [Rhizobiales bacterium]|nr:D-alanyl-D-alanine carboxypeptidase [Hyphomicrobiales bacterium]